MAFESGNRFRNLSGSRLPDCAQELTGVFLLVLIKRSSASKLRFNPFNSVVPRSSSYMGSGGSRMPRAREELETTGCCSAMLTGVLTGSTEGLLDTGRNSREYDSRLVFPSASAYLRSHLRYRPQSGWWLLLGPDDSVHKTLCFHAMRTRRRALPAIRTAVLERDSQKRRSHRSDLEDEANPKYAERRLISELLADKQVLQGFPYICEYEWEVEPGKPQGGVGDLVFTDGQGLFVVVEAKHICPPPGIANKSRCRNNRYRKAKGQARTYGEAFRKSHPEAVLVLAASYTTVRKIQWVQLDGQQEHASAILAEAAAATVSAMKLPSPKADDGQPKISNNQEDRDWSELWAFAATATATAGLALGCICLATSTRK